MPHGEFPPNVVELIQRGLTQFGRVGATKGIIAPALSAPVAAAGAGGPGLGGPSQIRFLEDGVVVAMYGQEQAGTVASFASTEVQVKIGGSENLFTDGQAGTFAPLLALFGPNLNWWPLWRRVDNGDIWTVNWRNQNVAATAIPTLMLAFIGDADLERYGAVPGRR